MIEFEGWPKIPRLSNLRVSITEKIDGTNAAIIINPVDTESPMFQRDGMAVTVVRTDRGDFEVGAQSRKKLIIPGKSTDNYGFAQWVQWNASELVDLLGPGRHYGEWWGQGIQGGYGMDRKVFSLFNYYRWSGVAEQRHGWRSRARDINMTTVPLMYSGKLWHRVVEDALSQLRDNGSYASPEWGIRFDRPEGVVVYFIDFDKSVKAFVDNDDVPKGLQGKGEG